MEIDIEDEVQRIIEQSLDVELSVEKYSNGKFLSVDLSWNGKAFAGHLLSLDKILSNERSEQCP